MTKVEPVNHDVPAGSDTADRFPAPRSISEAARAWFAYPATEPAVYPALDDFDGWREHVAQVEAGIQRYVDLDPYEVPATERVVGGVRIDVLQPEGTTQDEGPVVLHFHGGGLIYGGGLLNRKMSARDAVAYRCTTWAVNYRMPPADPFPAALDDALAAYVRLLAERSPQQIVVGGGSAGGNLAAALLLRARDEGLPMPAALVLASPEVDLTESGDSFQVNQRADITLSSLAQVNALYAGGRDLTDPYLSPLFGDLSGFPPTFIQSGTRDLYLSNAVRFHRKLLAQGVAAELHVFEARPHGGLPGTDEDREVGEAIGDFVQRHLPPAAATQGPHDVADRGGAGAPPTFLPPGERERHRPARADIHEGLTYAALDGYRPLQMNVYVPQARLTATPVVLWIHGGAWLFGSRELPPEYTASTNVFQSLIDAGLAVATIDYRHSREASFPAQLHDAKAAVRYLRYFAGELGIEPARVGVWGDSAGGHLAALLGLVTDPTFEGDEGVVGPSSEIAAVVDFYGVADVDTMPSFLDSAPPEWVEELQVAGGAGPVEPIDVLLENSPMERVVARRLVSPVSHVNRDSPPFLLVHGEADGLVPIAQSEQLHDALEAVGVEVHFTRVPGADHGLPGVDCDPYIQSAVAFLRRHLAG